MNDGTFYIYLYKLWNLPALVQNRTIIQTNSLRHYVEAPLHDPDQITLDDRYVPRITIHLTTCTISQGVKCQQWLPSFELLPGDLTLQDGVTLFRSFSADLSPIVLTA